MAVDRLQLLERLSTYISESTTTSEEYFVGIVPESHATAVERLKQSNRLSRSYVSYPKSLVDESVSYVNRSSWVYRESALSHFQLHVVIFEMPFERETLYVYCHYELNSVRHPILHLRKAYLDPEIGKGATIKFLDEVDLRVLRFSYE